MGTLRLFLALCVIEAHFQGFLPDGFFGGKVSVEIFFVISGFYMAMAYPKYSRPGLFLESRLLRIFPPYFVVLLLSLSAFALSGSLTGEWGYLRVFFRNGTYVGASMTGWLAWVSNFTVFFQDVTTFFSTSGATTFGAEDDSLPIPLHSYLAVPISWTIALELYFYFLVPWLSKLSNQRLFYLMCLSLCLKLSTVAFPEFTRDPWNYRFFPFELCLFLAGFISYRIVYSSGNKPSQTTNFVCSFERYRSNQPKLFLAAVWVLLAASLPILRFISAPFDTLAIILIFAAILPLLFTATKRNRLDQSIGELSYPIYLIHLPLGWLIFGLLKHSGLPTTHAPLLTGLGSICASIVLIKTVFPPLERFRMRFKH